MTRRESRPAAAGVRPPIGGVLRLQRTAGNAALGRILARWPSTEWVDSTLGAVGDVSSKLASTVIEASVGAGGVNAPGDMFVVSMRLSGLGFADQPLSAAIERYQREVLGFTEPDGRVDPEGKTLKALRAGRGAAKPATPGAPSSGGAAPTPVPTTPTGGGPIPTPEPTQPSVPSGSDRRRAPDRLVLAGAVGPGKANQPADVAAVRARLAELGQPAGASDDELFAAIRAFQSKAFGTTTKKKVDGIVAPGGATHNALIVGYRAGSGRADADVEAVVAASTTPAVIALRTRLAELEAFRSTIALNKNEEQGAARDQLVARIGTLRDEIERLDTGGLDDADAVRIWAHRKLNRLAPFYSQGRNVNLLEADKTRTCNITVVAMCLEALGKSTADYPVGELQPLRQARRFTGEEGKYNWAKAFEKAEDADADADAVAGPDADVLGLRLPDFLQLAMIARRMPEKSLLEAQKHAWDDILFPDRFAEVARKFGVAAYLRSVDGAGSTTEERLRNGIGGLLDEGKQLVGSTTGHFVKVESLTDKGLIIDDPGSWTKVNLLVPWSQASSYLKRVLVIG